MARKMAVSSCVRKDSPACSKRETASCKVRVAAPEKEAREILTSPDHQALTSTVALAYELEAQHANAAKVDNFRGYEELVMVFDDPPKKEQYLQLPKSISTVQFVA